MQQKIRRAQIDDELTEMPDMHAAVSKTISELNSIWGINVFDHVIIEPSEFMYHIDPNHPRYGELMSFRETFDLYLPLLDTIAQLHSKKPVIEGKQIDKNIKTTILSKMIEAYCSSLKVTLTEEGKQGIKEAARKMDTEAASGICQKHMWMSAMQYRMGEINEQIQIIEKKLNKAKNTNNLKTDYKFQQLEKQLKQLKCARKSIQTGLPKLNLELQAAINNQLKTNKIDFAPSQTITGTNKTKVVTRETHQKL